MQGALLARGEHVGRADVDAYGEAVLPRRCPKLALRHLGRLEGDQGVASPPAWVPSSPPSRVRGASTTSWREGSAPGGSILGPCVPRERRTRSETSSEDGEGTRTDGTSDHLPTLTLTPIPTPTHPHPFRRFCHARRPNPVLWSHWGSESSAAVRCRAASFLCVVRRFSAGSDVIGWSDTDDEVDTVFLCTFPWVMTSFGAMYGRHMSKTRGWDSVIPYSLDRHPGFRACAIFLLHALLSRTLCTPAKIRQARSTSVFDCQRLTLLWWGAHAVGSWWREQPSSRPGPGG